VHGAEVLLEPRAEEKALQGGKESEQWRI